MPDKLLTPVTGRTAWLGSELTTDDAWRHTIDDTEQAELLAATSAVRARGLGTGDFGRDDFPLPSLGRELTPEFADCYNTGPRGGVPVGDGARYAF